jgi:propionyl-CoA carboxylase alpha chain
VEVGGRRISARIARFGDRVVVHDGAGDIELVLVPRFVVPGLQAPTGGLNAPMPGKVLEVRTAVGHAVVAGGVLVVLEAMKMEHRITAPWDGMVSVVHVEVGHQVELGAPLLVVDPVPAVEPEG